LCVSLVRAFEFSYEAGANTSALLLAEDGSGLTLNPAFEAAIKDLRNFSVKDDLLRLYPELAPCFHPEPSCRVEDDPGSCNVVSAPSTAMAEPTAGEEQQTSLSNPADCPELPEFDVMDAGDSNLSLTSLDFAGFYHESLSSPFFFDRTMLTGRDFSALEPCMRSPQQARDN
jgi:hypothetical protein